MKTKKSKLLVIGILLFAFMAISAPKFNAVANAKQQKILPGKIVVVGEGQIESKPDNAHLSFTVQTENATLAEAEKENKEKIANIKNKLTSLGVEQQNIKTTSFYASQKFSYEEKEPKIVGYCVNNTISCKITNLDSVNSVISGIIEDGATAFNGITFVSSQTVSLYNQALSKAVENAKEKAAALTGDDNLILVKIIEEKSHISNSFKTMSYSQHTEDQSSIFEGQLFVKASITAVFDTQKDEQAITSSSQNTSSQQKPKSTRQIVKENESQTQNNNVGKHKYIKNTFGDKFVSNQTIQNLEQNSLNNEVEEICTEETNTNLTENICTDNSNISQEICTEENLKLNIEGAFINETKMNDETAPSSLNNTENANNTQREEIISKNFTFTPKEV
ncbi:MAG: SIMPL domain-containing protein [Christensenellales bacterium]|jgi:uncharacterized protein YggE